jgi:hypothetical protein
MRRDRHSKDTVIAMLRKSHGQIAPAAQALGYTRTALYDYIKRHQLEPIVNEEREACLDWAELHLWKQIVDGNLTAIIFFLKCQGKSMGYIERHEVSGKDGGAIEVENPFAATLMCVWEREHAQTSPNGHRG